MNRFKMEKDQETQNLVGEKPSDKPKRPQRQRDFYDKMEEFGQWLWIKVIMRNIKGSCSIMGFWCFLPYLQNQLFQITIPQLEYKLRLFLSIAMILIGVNVALSIYAAFILPYILKVKEDIEEYNPQAIQIGAFTGFMSFLTLSIAIWPIWGWLSMPILLALFLGFINTGHFLPNNQFSGFLFGMIFVGAFCSHLFIDHDGDWV
ncbi:hypothetical protein pb186bvf_012353 [Paramecium bursaria]